VRRSLDNTEQDIQFAGGQLDQAALQAFVGYENLVQRSEEFDNVIWAKGNAAISANSTTAPNGTLTADTFIETAVNSFHQLTNLVTTISGQTYTFSVYVKQAAGTRLIGLQPVGAGGAGNNQTAAFDLVNGTFLGNIVAAGGGSGVGTPFDSTNTSIQSVGNGWYRISCTTTVTGTSYALAIALLSSFSTAGLSYLGDGVSGLYLWGAQLNAGTTAQNYQQTIATANTANGFVTRWYTQDGNGQNLLLQSQTFEAAQWTKSDSIVSANSTTAPDGTLSADTVIPSTVLNAHYVIQSVIKSGVSQIYTVSAYVKAAGYTAGSIGATGLNTLNQANFIFDLTTLQSQAITNGVGFTNISSSLVSVGNGWFRVSMTFSSDATTVVQPYIRVDNAYLSPTYSGNGTSGLFVWGAQLSQSSWLQGYQATTTTTVSRRDASQSTAASQPRIVNAGVIERENGKPSIRFDGVDDTLGIASVVTYTTTGNQYISAVVKPETTVTTATTGFSILLNTLNQDYRLATGFGSYTSLLTNERFSFVGPSAGGTVFGYGQTISDIDPSVKVYSLSIDNPSAITSVFQNGVSQALTTAGGGPFTSSIYPNTINTIVSSASALDMQEAIIWGVSRSAQRQLIDSNLASYYQAYWSGAQQSLLDQFGGSAAAFSLRNLSSSYRGPLVRVRRSSDNAETDIGGTFSGDLDVNSLLAFTGGQNLILYSEDFTNASWVKSAVTVTGNATIAPDGTLTADKLAETATTSAHKVNSNLVSLPAGSNTGYIYAKAAERNLIVVNVVNTLSPYPLFSILVDLSSGLSSNSSVPQSGGILYSSLVQPAGNGWYRISITGYTTSTSSVNHILEAYLATGTIQNHTTTYAGVAGSGVYVWGAQLTTGSVLQPYIPTTTAAINGANAFVTKWYDQSGIGDNLVLQSETFGNASWTKNICTVAENVGVDPFGGNNADKILEQTATAQSPALSQTFSVSAGTTYVVSIYAKAAERNFVLVNAQFGGIDYVQLIDLTTGSVVANLANPPYTVENAGNGWWRLAVFFTAATSGTATVYVAPKPTAAIANYNTTANSGILIYGAQVSASSQLLRYQPTTTAAAPKRDAVQTTAASQPRIVNAGSVESENGKPSIFFTGSTFLNTLNGLTSNSGYAFAVYNSLNGQFRISQSKGTLPDLFFSLDDTAATSSPKNVRFLELNNAGVYNISGGSSDIYNKQNIATYSSNGTSWSAWLNSMPQSLSQISGSNSGAWFGDYNYPLYIQRLNVLTPLNTLSSNQEIVIFDSNLSATRASVESNINTYYQIYWQGNGTALLDSFSGASAAYSLRNLSSSYTGPLIRVRRSNDNAERDIYGTFRGDLDLAALTSFVGANSGFVTTWYDQSGIGDNLLLQSQTFENVSWNKVNSTISTNTITAPDGTLTGETIFETVTAGSHYMYQSSGTSVGVYTYSLYIKYLNRKYILLDVNDATANGAGVVFDIETASFVGNSTIGTGYSVLSYSITNLSDGWSRYSVTVSASGIAAGELVLRNSNSLVWANTYTGNTSTGVYIWGAQLSRGSQLLRYQPTTTAIAPVRNAVQATAASQPRIVNAGAVDTLGGKPSVVFDGTNDFMSFADLTAPQFTSFYPQKKDANADFSAWFTTSNALGGSPYSPIIYGVSGTYIGNGSNTYVWSSYQNNNYILISGYMNSTNQGFIQVNNAGLTIFPHTEPNLSNTFNRMNARTGVNQYSKCSVPEMILYAFDNSANISAINNSINNYYKIY
jgi:hypothetical protein